MHAKRVDPKRVCEFRVTRSDVTRHAFIKPEAGKQTKRCCQHFFSMHSLLLNTLEFGGLWQGRRNTITQFLVAFVHAGNFCGCVHSV
jgi:hypothetical protein